MLGLRLSLVVLLLLTAAFYARSSAAEEEAPRVYEVRAALLLFDRPSISVVAGSNVVIKMINEDFMVPHNIGLDIPGLPPSDLCAGPCEATLAFTAPTPGITNSSAPFIQRCTAALSSHLDR
jgi:hypothetical protein